MTNLFSTIKITMTWTCKITLKCTLRFKMLQLIQCIVVTDNNDVCVRDVVIQMQMVPFKIGVCTVNLFTINWQRKVTIRIKLSQWKFIQLFTSVPLSCPVSLLGQLTIMLQCSGLLKWARKSPTSLFTRLATKNNFLNHVTFHLRKKSS